MNRFMGEATPSSYFYDLNGKITIKPTSDDIISLSFYNGQDILDNSSDFNFSKGGMSISGGRRNMGIFTALNADTVYFSISGI